MIEEGSESLWELATYSQFKFIQSLLMLICTYEPEYDFLQDGDALGDSLNSRKAVWEWGARFHVNEASSLGDTQVPVNDLHGSTPSNHPQSRQ